MYVFQKIMWGPALETPTTTTFMALNDLSVFLVCNFYFYLLNCYSFNLGCIRRRHGWRFRVIFGNVCVYKIILRQSDPPTEISGPWTEQSRAPNLSFSFMKKIRMNKIDHIMKLRHL